MSPTASREEQKRRELTQFEAFREACKGVPQCPVSQPPEPEPDIVLNCPTGLVGLELTEIHPSGEAKRKREGEQDIVTTLAKRLYEKSNLSPVQVFIHWASSPGYQNAHAS